MIEELVGRVFLARNAAHLEHWRTKSYAQHKALGNFYEDVIESIDAIVEVHQGVMPLIAVNELPRQPKYPDIVTLLEDDLVWITENRAKITSKLPAIDNLVQELERVYMRTLYKLRNLS